MLNPFKFFSTGQDKPVIQDQSKVDELYKKSRRGILPAITIGYGSYYTCRLALSVVKKPLIDSGVFTVSQIGTIGSAIFFGYAFGKLINGFLADHSNLRKLFSTGLLCSAIINLIMGSVGLFWVFVILWGFNGWFQSFGAPSSMVTLAHWFSNHERGRYYGVWSTAHSIGEGITFVGTSAMVSCFGWRAGFLTPGLFCIVVAVAAFILMRDRPQTLGLPAIADWKRDHGQVVEIPVKAVGHEHANTVSLQFSVFKRPALWILAVASACMYITRYAIDSWGIFYLQEAKGYSLVEAGTILGLNTFAGILGSVAYGFISDKLFNARRPPVTLMYGLVEILALFVIFFVPTGNKLVVGTAFVVYGFTLSGLLAVIAGLFPMDIMPKRAAGAVIGFMGIISYFGAAVQEQVTAHLIGSGVIIEGVKQHDFSRAVVFWIGASVVSMLLAASLWRAKPMD